MFVVGLAVGLFLGVIVGRIAFQHTIKYDGNIVKEVTEAGTRLYSLELDENLDLDKFDEKKTIVFKMVPPQPSLL